MSRWSASWIDGNFAGHFLEIEAFIVEAQGGSVINLTFTNVGDAIDHEATVAPLVILTDRDQRKRLSASPAPGLVIRRKFQTGTLLQDNRRKCVFRATSSRNRTRTGQCAPSRTRVRPILPSFVRRRLTES